MAKILLVENDRVNRDMLPRLLERRAEADHRQAPIRSQRTALPSIVLIGVRRRARSAARKEEELR